MEKYHVTTFEKIVGNEEAVSELAVFANERNTSNIIIETVSGYSWISPMLSSELSENLPIKK